MTHSLPQLISILLEANKPALNVRNLISSSPSRNNYCEQERKPTYQKVYLSNATSKLFIGKGIEGF